MQTDKGAAVGTQNFRPTGQQRIGQWIVCAFMLACTVAACVNFAYAEGCAYVQGSG